MNNQSCVFCGDEIGMVRWPANPLRRGWCCHQCHTFIIEPPRSARRGVLQKIKRPSAVAQLTAACVICLGEIKDWPNNASPVIDGECCQSCNDTIVLPSRARAR